MELELLHATLKLLADPTRLRLVALLSAEELAVGELVTITGLGQSRISNHLSLLKRAGLVQERREGTWSFHSLKPLSGEALTPELFAAAVQPFLGSDVGRSDVHALEKVRENRREQSRRRHDQLAPAWSRLGQEFELDTLRAEAFAALVPAGLVVADLGCGAGYLTSYLLSRGARVIAVDHSAVMLDQARGQLSGSAVEFRRGELDRLPLGDGEVDAAVANLVWHHLADWDQVAVEIFRVLAPGGRLVITDLLPHEEDWMRQQMGDHRLGVPPEQVMTCLQRAGFENLAWEHIKDRYVVGGSQKTSLPLFLVHGMRPHRARSDDHGSTNVRVQ